MNANYCKTPPCGKCPEWPAHCPTCHYAKDISPERYEAEMALLAQEADTLTLTVDSTGGAVLIVNYTPQRECKACGMDETMQSDLEICPVCGKCLHWEDEFGVGRCCTCPKTEVAS